MVLLAAMALTCSRKAPDRNAGRDGIGASAAKQIGTIEDRSIREASGIAASRRTPDIFWVINDSRNPPVLYGIAFEGQDRKSTRPNSSHSGESRMPSSA